MVGASAKRDELLLVLQDRGWTRRWWGLSDGRMAVVFSWASRVLAGDRRWQLEGMERRCGRGLVGA